MINIRKFLCQILGYQEFCPLLPTETVEELIAGISTDMTNQQKAQYWYELSQTIFSLLGKVDVPIFEITPDEWIAVAQAQYPSLIDIKIADSKFYTTSIEGLQEILTQDWTNLAPYFSDIGDCDKFATRLYIHLCDYYKINAVVPVWGDTSGGYHGFNLGVLKQGEVWVARLIEPQTDALFVDNGPLGQYVPRILAVELGVVKNRRIV